MLNNLSSITYIDEDKLRGYLEDYGKAYLYQKTGFLLSMFKKQMHLSSGFFRRCKANIGQSTRYLTDVSENILYDAEWRLCVPADLSDSISMPTNTALNCFLRKKKSLNV